jgi:5-methylcytosine-specific restriction endonuclease McrA
MTYEEQLKDERWLYLRNRILDRDWRICQHCLTGKGLQVHHRYYDEGKMAWEYPDLALITLCKKCHEAEHEKHGPCPDDPLLRLVANFRHILYPARTIFRKR